MIQKEFAEKVIAIVENDPVIIGLAAGGSWISEELDEFSDLDLVLVTKEKIGSDSKKMMDYARSFGKLLSGFTGEHVGEPRLLVCLYDNPLLHVDIKFVTPDEFHTRVENPVVLFEREGQLNAIIHSTSPNWPYPDFQWIEDRFWTWVHYIAGKIGRGEYFETLSSLDYLRANVLSPLMQVKNKQLPRALRKAESRLTKQDLENLKKTVASYNRSELLKALDETIASYLALRKEIYTDNTILQTLTEKKSLDYLEKIKQINSLK